MGIITAILNLTLEESFLESVAFTSFLALAVKTAIDYYYIMHYYETLITSFLHSKT